MVNVGMRRDYDVIILGSGPAGFSCAMQSSKFDKKALVVESDPTHLGGTWINTGTIPSKSLREAAKSILAFNTQFRSGNPKPYETYKMQELLQYKDDILEQENQQVEDDLLRNNVAVVRGFGRLKDAHTVEVTTVAEQTKTYTASNILVSTGSSPEVPTAFDIDHNKVLDYESLLNITHIPRRLVIVGSGALAVEYATIFAALGSRVSMLSNTAEDLPFLDEEIRHELWKAISPSITRHNDSTIKAIKYNSLRGYTEVHFTDQNQPRRQVIETEHVLHLGNRKANTQEIGLEALEINLDEEDRIITDEHYQTDVSNIYAAGDVLGFPQLASASFAQGRQAACNMFGIPSEANSNLIPYGLYSIPEVSQIGLTEKEARDRGINITVGLAHFKEIAKANMTQHPSGLLKLIFNTETLKLLGVHIVGDEATNLIHLGQSVLSFGGDVRYFIRHVMNYPTLSEAYRIAAFNGMNRIYKGGVTYQQTEKKNSK